MTETRRILFERNLNRFEVDFCEPKLNILAHAQAIELDIGSRCGGHGICGGDRIQISIDESKRALCLSPITDSEREHLTPDELAQGYRLACQCFPEKPAAQLTVRVTS